MDLCIFVKTYLDKKDVIDRVFKDNMPHNDWADLFIKWHSLTQRLADNVCPSHLQVSSDNIKVYFQNLSEALERIPETNIFNYDETNVTDDPSQKSALYREGLQEFNKKQNIQSSRYQLCLVKMQLESTYHQCIRRVDDWGPKRHYLWFYTLWMVWYENFWEVVFLNIFKIKWKTAQSKYNNWGQSRVSLFS